MPSGARPTMSSVGENMELGENAEPNSQVKDKVELLHDAVKRADSTDHGKPGVEPLGEENQNATQMNVLQQAMSSTGHPCVQAWRQPLERPERTEWAVANADPGIFKGARNEDFKGFIRKFRRKYEEVVKCESTLIEILSDDHLSGRAKNIFMALPGAVKEQGYGHIGRECPQRATRVNQIGKKEQQEGRGKATLSSIVDQARSPGDGVRLLNGENPALIDTGSMISIVPVEVLGKAKDRGFDVDTLKLVEKSQLAPVFDASENKMEFLGAVFIETELEGGNRCVVPFHISPAKDEELILGTNALSRLGVEVSIVRNEVEGNRRERKGTMRER
ncbi:hypothetical protein OSTOST_14870 [Ostertagia ostertagi]